MSDVTATLKERGARYGAFNTQAEIAQHLKTVMRSFNGWHKLEPDMREALDIIQHKIARILNGDPHYADSWHDIAGYAVLVEQRLNALGSPEKMEMDFQVKYYPEVADQANAERSSSRKYG